MPNGRHYSISIPRLIYSHLDAPSESSKSISPLPPPSPPLSPPYVSLLPGRSRMSSNLANDTTRSFCEGLNHSFYRARGFISLGCSPSSPPLRNTQCARRVYRRYPNPLRTTPLPPCTESLITLGLVSGRRGHAIRNWRRIFLSIERPRRDGNFPRRRIPRSAR